MVQLFSFACNGVEPPQEKRSTVSLTTGEGYFPYVDNQFIFGGWSRALVQQTFLLMELDIDVEILPWSRGFKWTKEGQFLGTFPYIYSPERAELFLFSLPINQVPIRMYVASNSAFKTIEQMQGKRLCIPHGYNIGHAEQLIINQYAMTVNRAKDSIGCVGQVQRTWSDAGLTNGYIAADKIGDTQNGDSPIVIFPQELSFEPLYFLISKTYPDAQKWMDQFNHAFETLEKNGQKQSIDQMFIHSITQP
jgi:polar amino acid transport system substrate-binding protein